MERPFQSFFLGGGDAFKMIFHIFDPGNVLEMPGFGRQHLCGNGGGIQRNVGSHELSVPFGNGRLGLAGAHGEIAAIHMLFQKGVKPAAGSLQIFLCLGFRSLGRFRLRRTDSRIRPAGEHTQRQQKSN